MLRGAPNNPAYRRDEAPTAIGRLAGSDLEYSDFSGSGLFFAAQTDWSGGTKSQRTWADDAKYYYSTNIDAFSEPGSIKLFKNVSLDETFTENISCASFEQPVGAAYGFVGTDDNTSGKPVIYKNSSGSTWLDISNGFMPTAQTTVTDTMAHKSKLWFGTLGPGATYVLGKCDDDGGSPTDYSSAIGTACSITPENCYCMAQDGNTLYAAVRGTAGQNHLVSTADGGTTWVDEFSNGFEKIICILPVAGQIYYLTLIGNSVKLKVSESGVETEIYKFADNSLVVGTAGTTGSGSRRLLKLFNGKIVISIYNEIWEYNPATETMTRIYQVDSTKLALGNFAEANIVPNTLLVAGPSEFNNKLYWGNLVYDGTVFYNERRDILDDNTSYFLFLLYNNGSTQYWMDNNNFHKLYVNSSSYKGTLAKNFLVLGEMSQVVSIDKLLYSITVIFASLATDEQIALEYSTNGGSSWTALSTMTTSTEGTGIKREFIIPNSIVYNKLFVRVKMAGVATTPTVQDLIVAYKPIPNYKSRWQLRLEMSNGVKLLNGQDEQDTGSDLLAKLWVEKNTKQIVSFEDVDYVEATLRTAMTSGQTSASVDSTKGFPRKGRIRAVSGGVAEEMVYTSAETNKIKGITRAQRGTRARAYLSGQIVKNDYSVYIEKIASDINFTDEKKTENIATVTLLEA